MNIRTLKTLATGTALALVVLAGTSCSGSGSDQPDCDYLMSAGVPVGTGITPYTDVRCAVFHSLDFNVNVDFRAVGTVGSTQFDQFRVSHYTVQYINKRTGGTVAGVDVPQPFTFVTPFEPQIVPAAFLYTGWPVLAAEAKARPPLSDPNFFATGSVDLRAVITFFGYPVENADKVCSTSFVYDFNVFDSGQINAPGCF